MVRGLGLDLCEISRMEKMLADERFLNRYFTEEEAGYIRSRGRSAAQTMAGIFAAKEALMKALGCGLASGELKDICVLHDSAGAPYYALQGEYARIAEEKGIGPLHLSITHEGGMAAAVCIAEKDG